MKTLTITIDTDGSLEIEATGFKGAACTKATAEIERALGVAKSRQLKSEYRNTTTSNKQTT